jgi:hypothetical protein
MGIEVITNYEKYQTKDILIKKIQDLRLKARDIEDFRQLKELKREIKEYQDFLNFLDTNEDHDLKKSKVYI